MKPELSIMPERPAVKVHKRTRIPLSVRYEVLTRQCPAEIVDKTEREGGTLKSRYSKLLCHAVCALSKDRLIEKGCEFDHRIPRALGGSNDPENIQALTPAEHKLKTDADKAAIAKANHNAELTGQKKLRDERGGSSIQSRNTLGGELGKERRAWAKKIKQERNGEIVERER